MKKIAQLKRKLSDWTRIWGVLLALLVLCVNRTYVHTTSVSSVNHASKSVKMPTILRRVRRLLTLSQAVF
jgi:hypothetical protein